MDRGGKEVKKVKSWRMATWNLQGGLLDPIKTIMVGDDLTKNGIDFVALQEVQSKEEKFQGLGKNHIEILLPKGKGSGLGFAVARKHKEKIMSFRIFSERVASVTIRAEEKKGTKMLTIINVHAPTFIINLETPEQYWNLRDRACKVTQWRPVVKGIMNQYEKGRRRLDCLELREGKRRRKEVKRKIPGQIGRVPRKRVRWGGGGEGV